MPDMVEGTVEMVPVEWILNNVNYSVDGFSYQNPDETWYIDWAEMLMDKSVNDAWAFNMVAETISLRGFRVPVVIDTGYALEWDCLTMGNGHHRLACAILFCLDEIPVYWAYNDYMSEHASEPESVGMDNAPWLSGDEELF